MQKTTYFPAITASAGAFVLGIVGGTMFEVPPLTLLVVSVVTMGGMLLCHWKHWSRCFLVVMCVLTASMGWLRYEQGDMNLMPDSVRAWGTTLNQQAVERLHAVGLDAPTEALLDAMLLGVRDTLPESLRQTYRDAGASHLLALSGLHLSILFGLLGFCFVHLIAIRPLRILFGLAIPWLLFAYAAVANFPPSLLRAACMLSMLTLSQLRMTIHSSWHALSVTALLMLFCCPSDLFDVGFQLSFCAVMGILFYYGPLHHFSHSALWRPWAVSLAAQIGSMPLSVYYFHTFATYAVLFSPVYILFATILLYGALLLLLGCHWLAPVLQACASVQHGLMQASAALPGSMLTDLYPSGMCVTLMYVSLLCFEPPLRATYDPYSPYPCYASAVLRRWGWLVAALVAATASMWV
ncbi:MAG: ComEC/Rec2 family competence protein [Bacteroidaceae bacterium]|nr:ComEC/Rec2 family competence protein [Bacteroidaceae bacterium]